MYSKKRKLENDTNNDYMIDKMSDWSIYRSGNEIHFTNKVTSETIQKVIKLITEIINENLKGKNKTLTKPLEITYVVDSPGGSVSAILKFVDFVNMVRKKYNDNLKFTSIISGSSASAGTIMAVIADKRLMTKNAVAMVHELSSGTHGKFTELDSYMVHLKDLHSKLVSIYQKATGQTTEKLESIMAKETWYNAEDYKSAGFIDEIL